jgi:hypothetical protein
MMKYLLTSLLLFFTFTCIAQRYTLADVQQVQLLTLGTFAAQDSSNTSKKDSLQVKPLWTKRKDGAWLLVAQKEGTTDSLVTDFYVWHFYLQDDTTLLLQLLPCKEAQKAADVFNKRALEASLSLVDLKNMNGCEVYIKRMKGNKYVGTNKGTDCSMKYPQAEHEYIEASFSKNGIGWWQKGLGKEAKQVAGSTAMKMYKKVIHTSIK